MSKIKYDKEALIYKRAPLYPAAPLSRRLILRGMFGAGIASVPLPILEGMLNPHGDAFAQGGVIPTRFGLWFWGNGVRPEHWVPTNVGQGDAWQLSSEMQPLSAHKSKLSALSGYTIRTGTHAHHAGMTGVMTGRPLHQVGVTRDTIVSTFDGPSVDMYAATHYEGETPFRSLEVGVTRFRGTDEGTTFQHLSHNGPNNPNPSEYNPIAVYERLFGVQSGSSDIRTRRSVLDAVMGQFSRLRPKLGVNDRRRVDQHFESIRALEQRLASEPVSCARPEEPSGYPDQNGLEQIEAKNTVMSQMVALALACDLTRVFSIQFSTCGSGVIIHEAGATDGLHRTCHDEPMSGNPQTQPIVHSSTIYTMGQLARFLDELDGIPMGAGTLLDHCSVMCTSEHTDGRLHRYEDFPFLIAGLGGGRLRGNVHARGNGDTSITHGVLTALRASGVPTPNFGIEAGYTEMSVDALET
jgi:hypothetical protein